jgi:hypothetical protein
MTAEGIQFELANTSTGVRNRQTMTWAEFHAN